MNDIIDGKMFAMHSDPKAVRKANKSILLTWMAALTLYPALDVAYGVGWWIGIKIIGG